MVCLTVQEVHKIVNISSDLEIQVLMITYLNN